MSERLRLSFSSIDSLLNCGLKYRFSKVDRLPQQPPTPTLSFGTSIHTAMEALFDVELGGLPDVEVALQALYDGWETDGFADASREEQVRWYRHAQDVVRRAHERFAAAPWRTPVAIEQFFQLPMDDIDVDVVGLIDAVFAGEADTDGNRVLHVVDWKTNRKAKSLREVAGSLQLAIYAMAAEHLWGALPASVALDFVVPGRRVEVPIDDIDLPAAREVIADAAARIRAQEFAPNPNPLCGWCDWRAECPAWSGDGPDVPATAVAELRKVERDLARLTERQAHLLPLVEQWRAEGRLAS